MISAVDAKRKMDECNINEELKKIEDKILSAAEKGYCRYSLNHNFVSSLSHVKLQKILGVLKENGYEISENNTISWENAGNGEEWVEKKRYDGSPFYVCGGCGGVAAAEKEDYCPNCRCKMRK